MDGFATGGLGAVAPVTLCFAAGILVLPWMGLLFVIPCLDTCYSMLAEQLSLQIIPFANLCNFHFKKT